MNCMMVIYPRMGWHSRMIAVAFSGCRETPEASLPPDSPVAVRSKASRTWIHRSRSRCRAMTRKAWTKAAPGKDSVVGRLVCRAVDVDWLVCWLNGLLLDWFFVNLARLRLAIIMHI